MFVDTESTTADHNKLSSDTDAVCDGFVIINSCTGYMRYAVSVRRPAPVALSTIGLFNV